MFISHRYKKYFLIAFVLSFVIFLSIAGTTQKANAACPPGTINVGAEGGEVCEPPPACADPSGAACVTAGTGCPAGMVDVGGEAGRQCEVVDSSCTTIGPLQIGFCSTSQKFGGYLQKMYGFLLAFVGIAAFGGITYGGLLYVFAAGSIGKVDEAKKWIWNALIGLLVTAISFILLSTINPDLVNKVSIDLCKYVPSACSGSTAPPTPDVSCDPSNDQCPSGFACIPSPAGGGVCRTTEVILK